MTKDRKTRPIFILMACIVWVATTLPATAGGIDWFNTMQESLHENSTNAPLLRGLSLPLLHSSFTLIMLCFGLWSGQMAVRMQTQWALPAAWLVGITIAGVTAIVLSREGITWAPFETSLLKNILTGLSPHQALVLTTGVFIGFLVGQKITMPPSAGLFVSLVLGGYSGLILCGNYEVPRNLLQYLVGIGIANGLLTLIGIGLWQTFDGAKLMWIPRSLGFLTIFLGFLTLINIYG